MKQRKLTFGLYADQHGMAWVKDIIEAAAATRAARVVTWHEERGLIADNLPVTEMYDMLADQWLHEHPGQAPGDRHLVELRVGVECSLRVWRTLRKTVLGQMCPEGHAPHVCRVPWMAM